MATAVEGSFGALVSRAWRDNVLFSVLIELTYRCNLDCTFCYNDLGLSGRPLATTQILGLLDDLRAMQVLNLTLSGGEPLAHPDFFAIGAHARAQGFVVRVKSNGHALGESAARRLRDEVDPFMVEVSLHGATAATHDRQTRVPGSFERLRRNLGFMVAAGLRVKLNAPLTAWNEHEIEGMFAIGDELGLRVQFDTDITPRDDGDLAPLAIAPSARGVARLMEIEIERARAVGARGAAAAEAVVPPAAHRDDETMGAPPHGKHCGAGSSGAAVDPYGNVYPCVQWRRPVGNLHDLSIKDIWASSAPLAAVRALQGRIKDVVAGLGPDAAAAAFCPGMAEAMTGDATKLYPGALRRLEMAAGDAPAAAPRRSLPVVR